jgi:hypothetical protein
MGQALNSLNKSGSLLAQCGLPEDPQDWHEKHRVKAALAMFDAYDKNNDDELDKAELRALFRDFASELKLFYHVGENISPSKEGIDAMVETLRVRTGATGATLTFLQFLPLFLNFTDELITQAAHHSAMG